VADDILNINGKLIRLKDNGDGTWSWATQLTGSIVQPADYTTTDSMVDAFTFDNLPECALLSVRNTGTNNAKVSSKLYLDGADLTINYFPWQNALVPAGGSILLPLAMFRKVVISAASESAGNPTTLRARVRAVGSPQLLRQPWFVSWTTPEAAAGASLDLTGVPTFGSSRVAVSVFCSVAHTFTAKLYWVDSGTGPLYFAAETIPDATVANQAKHGVFDVKKLHGRVRITNSDTVAHSYTVAFLLLP
jgi:hypothetical protein